MHEETQTDAAEGAAVAAELKRARMAEYDLRTTLLQKTCLVHITDGRAFKGTFTCVDSARNLLLTNATEYKVKNSSSRAAESGSEEYDRRFVGFIMIPGAHIKKLELQAGLRGPSTQTAPATAFPTDLSLYA